MRKRDRPARPAATRLAGLPAVLLAAWALWAQLPGDAVTDLVIANLTVHNTYGGLHVDHDHQFAIRSGGQATPDGAIRGPNWTFTTRPVSPGPTETRRRQPPPRILSWAEILDQPVPWYGSTEAVRIGGNVLLYQRNTGGWPKNIDMARVLSGEERATIAAEKPGTDSTIDNGATTTQIRFLARVYAATRDEKMRAGAAKGLRYLLEAQYPNGGWPQFFPLRPDYSRYITFNDGVMVRTLELMRDAGGDALVFSFLDEQTKTRARRAYETGLKLVLATQLKSGGALTGWCAQYDARTLEPRGARTYEHVSIDSRETTDVARFLMTIDKPSPAIAQAVEGAVSWLKAVAISGLRVEMPPEPAAPNGHDRVVVPDPSAPSLWARFYEIGTNQPIYSGRDGVIKHSLAEIELERRSGYNWIDRFAATLLESDYPAWRKATGR